MEESIHVTRTETSGSGVPIHVPMWSNPSPRAVPDSSPRRATLDSSSRRISIIDMLGDASECVLLGPMGPLWTSILYWP